METIDYHGTLIQFTIVLYSQNLQENSQGKWTLNDGNSFNTVIFMHCMLCAICIQWYLCVVPHGPIYVGFNGVKSTDGLYMVYNRKYIQDWTYFLPSCNSSDNHKNERTAQSYIICTKYHHSAYSNCYSIY
jgi:hypothetical protein